MPQSDGKHTLKRMEFEFKGKVYSFNLNPEEFEQDEPSRSTVNQTKGGAWIDDFGGGLVTIYMKGSTGFRNGFDKFKELRQTIRNYMNSTSPGDTVKDELLFHNFTDEESWVVHLDPSAFKLYRSKSNPLMFMYEIRLICLRPAQMPATSSVSQVTVLSSSSMSKVSAKNLSTKLGVSSDDKVSSTFSAYTNDLKILNSGQVQIQTTNDTSSVGVPENNLRSQISPVLTPQVSNSALNYQKLFLAGEGDETSQPLDSSSFLYQVIYGIDKTKIPNEVNDVIKMIVLETYSVYKSYAEDPSNFSSRISKDDLTRLIGNIRWVTDQLGEIDDPDFYDIIEGLKEIEIDIGYLRSDSTLFEKDVSKTLAQYMEAGS